MGRRRENKRGRSVRSELVCRVEVVIEVCRRSHAVVCVRFVADVVEIDIIATVVSIKSSVVVEVRYAFVA